MTTQAIKERPLPRFEHRTGLDYEQLLYLEREVTARIGSWQPATGRRKSLDLFEAIIVTLTYLRHNTIQAAVGEQARISQATVSRYIETLEPVVSCCLDCLALDLQRRAARGDLVVDGFLIPTRDLTSPKGLFSGERRAGPERPDHLRSGRQAGRRRRTAARLVTRCTGLPRTGPGQDLRAASDRQRPQHDR